MSLRAHVGSSSHRQADAAGREAASAARQGLGLHAPGLALVFATVGYDQGAVLAAVRAELGDCPVAGCSGEGVIGPLGSTEVTHAIQVVAFAFEGTSAESILIDGYGDHPAATAQRLADRVERTPGVHALMVFPDGLVGDCSVFLEALRARLPHVAIVGGASGDAMTFQRTYQYGDGRVGTGAVAAVALSGAGRMRVGVSHGCAPIGPLQTITETDGTWVCRIDGQPAWDVFKEYLDGDPQTLNADGIVHLCIGTAADPNLPLTAGNLVIRTPLALDATRGALMFPGGGLRPGQRIRMTRRDHGQVRSTAAQCAHDLVAGEATPPALILQFDCAGRGKVMFGSETDDYIFTPLRTAIGEQVPWVGFHTYGEIAESAQGLRYHNYSVALCALYDC